MRRTSTALLCAAALCLTLTACGAPGADASAGNPPKTSASAAPIPAAGSPTPLGDKEPLSTMTAKIVSLDGANAVVVNQAEDAGAAEVVTIGLEGQTIVGVDGTALTAADLKPGMVIEIGYSMIQETFPGKFADVSAVRVVAQEEDLVGFYLDMLDDLMKTDEGLNEGITMLAFDLSGEVNLTEPEKSALRYLAGIRFGVEMNTVERTFDALCEEGLIDREKLYFETGLLIQLNSEAVEGDTFRFDAEKWRGGLGAYYFHDCTAKKADGAWSYTIGAEMIS